MAERKPLFISTEGFPQEMAISDSMSLGGLTMGGDIDMDSAGQPVNVNSGTASGDVLVYGQTGAELTTSLTITGTVSNDTHAATKGYVDTQMVTGGAMQESILTMYQTSNTVGILAATALSIQVLPANDDRIVLTNGTTTRTYYFGTGTGDVQVATGGTAVNAMNNLATAINNDSTDWYAYAYTTSGDLDSIDEDGVIVIRENSTASGESKIYGTNWDADDCKIVDFSGEDDYSKKALTDISSSEPGSTNFGFRRTKANLTNGEMHVNLGDDRVSYWDEDGDAWQTFFSGIAAVVDATSGSGGATKGKATFDSDYGLTVSSGVAEVTFASNPGMEFDGSGNIQIDRANADQLNLAVDGLQMIGVPPNFELNGVATHNNVTAANMDDLTDGSNADSLHAHTGSSVTLNHSDVGSITANQHHDQSHVLDGSDHTESGLTTGHVLTATGTTTFGWQAIAEATAAESIENTMTTQTDATTNGDPVYVNANDKVGKARANDNSASRVLGVIRTGAGAAGSNVEVVSAGPCEGVLSGATVNTPYYLGDTGGISTSLPTAGYRVICLGYAMNATDLYVRMHDYGKSAP